jgi:hypothetical protein
MIEFLSSLFGDAPGKIEVYSADTDSVATYHLDEAVVVALKAGAEIDLTTSDYMVVAVVDRQADPEDATFWLVNGDETVPVFVFDAPVDATNYTFPADLGFTIPAPGGDWTVVGKTNEYYTVEALFGEPTEEEPTDAPANGDVHDDNPFLSASDGAVLDEDDAGDVEDAPAVVDDASLDDDGEFLKEVTARTPEDVENINAEPEGVEPEEFFDALVLGESTPEMEALLDKPAVFMVGKVYESADPRRQDPRNTKGGDWVRAEMTWRAWLEGGDGDANNPEWGLARHPEAKQKDGDSLVFAETMDGERLKNAVVRMFAIGIDIDSGDSLKSVVKKIRDLGLLCFVHTSYNNGKSSMELKQQTVMSKLRIDHIPSIVDVRRYLTEHQRGKYDTPFISGLVIEEEYRHPSKGQMIRLKTPPMEKFRLIFPMLEPVELLDLAPTIDAACAIWEDKVTGLGHKLLDVNFDAACTDVCRLFFTPRHHPDSENWNSLIIQGRPLTFDEVPTYKKSVYVKTRGDDADNAFLVAASGEGMDDRPKECFAPSGASLNAWHHRFKERFMLADAIEHFAIDKVRESGAEASGTVHTECPFEHLHSKEGGTATMAMNALDAEQGYWTWFCHHDSCQDRKKLEFLEQALKDEWFPESVLTEDIFLAAAEDGDVDDEDETSDTVYSGDEVYKTPDERAAEFGMTSSEIAIKAFLKQLRVETTDRTVWNSVKDILDRNTRLKKIDLNAIWGELQREEKADAKKAEDADAANFKGFPIVREWDDSRMCEYALRRLEDSNDKDPHLFRYMRRYARISEDEQGMCYIDDMDEGAFAHELNKVARFEEKIGDSIKRGVFAPSQVVKHLFKGHLEQFPPLRGVVNTPTFAFDGSMITNEGYHDASQLFYAPDLTLTIPAVSTTPTDTEVDEAKRLLIEEVLADFPLGGHTRKEIVENGLYGDGLPAVTNMVGLIILPFVREMIDGPTPGHMLTKPTPGVGASLLTEVMHMITLGTRGAATTFPSGSLHEIRQTLFSLFRSAAPIVWFDNINESLDSGELAAAMTTSVYNARELGKSNVIPVDVRCSWIFTGNNVLLSNELLRRLCMIDLDAKMANPEERSGWRHGDIIGWVRKNRGSLVWACLTLIQHWIANDQPAPQTPALATYENWTRVVGGVLENAGLLMFMENRNELRERSSDGDSDSLQDFVDAWWDNFGSTTAYVKMMPNSKAEGLREMAIRLDLGMVGVKKEKNIDSDTGFAYNANSFGQFLKRYSDRVFDMEDGVSVRIEQHPRQKYGYPWSLVEVTKVSGNISLADPDGD